MIQQYNNSIKLYFDLKYNFSAAFNWIEGVIFVNLSKSNLLLVGLNENFRGKPIVLPLSLIKEVLLPGKTSIKIMTINLIPSLNSDFVGEIIYKEPKYELLIEKHFPIYYFIKNTKDNNLNINFRIKELDDKRDINFTIKGYRKNYNDIRRKQHGEYIELTDPIFGSYKTMWNIGNLEIINNNTYMEEDEYILIHIDTEGNEKILNVSFEITALFKSNEHEYLIPVNQYLLSTFTLYPNDSYNKYLIKTPTKKRPNNVLSVEYYKNFGDEDIEFNNTNCTHKSIIGGFQRCLIEDYGIDSEFKFILKKPKKSGGYIIIRYFFTEVAKENTYNFDVNSIQKLEPEVDGKISLSFNNIKITRNGYYINQSDINITKYKIFGTINEGNDNFFSFEDREDLDYTFAEYEDEKFNLTFTNKKERKKYSINLFINVLILNFFFNEQFLFYQLPYDTSDSDKDQNSDEDSTLSKTIILIIIIISVVVLIIIILSIFIICRLKKKNNSLKQKIDELSEEALVYKSSEVQMKSTDTIMV